MKHLSAILMSTFIGASAMAADLPPDLPRNSPLYPLANLTPEELMALPKPQIKAALDAHFKEMWSAHKLPDDLWTRDHHARLEALRADLNTCLAQSMPPGTKIGAFVQYPAGTDPHKISEACQNQKELFATEMERKHPSQK